jgi:hypothetical protein
LRSGISVRLCGGSSSKRRRAGVNFSGASLEQACWKIRVKNQQFTVYFKLRLGAIGRRFAAGENSSELDK